MYRAKLFFSGIVIFFSLFIKAECQETVAFADFSHFPDGDIISNCFNFEARGCDRNPHYGEKMRFLGQGATMRADFFLLNKYYDKVLIRLKHLSSKSDQARSGGYSPMTLELNGSEIFENYSPENKLMWESFDISDAVEEGKNTIMLKANRIQTHYWLQRFEVVLIPPDSSTKGE